MERWEIILSGLVQGIGLRPMIYHFANQYHLSGSVQNTEQGVRLFWQGSVDSLTQAFTELEIFLKLFGPFQSKCIKHPVNQDKGFTIKPSIGQAHACDSVSIDIATCHLCLKELFEPQNRRFCYPFITCAQCGPRYSMTQCLPFDRKNTAMQDFPLCLSCQKEYQDPHNRRFHAQTISCYICGPKLWLCDRDGKTIAKQERALEAALSRFLKGKILAVKGIGGFHLMVLANHHEGVETLRKRKCRPHKPFALMVKDLAQAKQFCYLSPLEEQALTSLKAPILIAKRRLIDNLSPLIAPQSHDFALMLPYTPLHHLLLSKLESPLVATSGNVSEEPICYQNEEALSDLNHIADYFLMHNREIINPLEDSIVQEVAHKIRVIRKARGHIPFVLEAPFSDNSQLAMGGQLKNNLAYSNRNKISLSPYIGNLTSEKSKERFYHYFNQYYQSASEPLLICDKHPDYASSYFTRTHCTSPLLVQHHLAHIFAVCAEFSIKGDFIGFAWDGLGHASTHHFWGGEAFLFNKQALRHFATLKTLSLLGGEKAIKEPRRIALSFFDEEPVPQSIAQLFQKQELTILQKMQKQSFLCYTTSSIGRLFDGIAVLLGGPPIMTYEAQAAHYLEQLACECTEEMEGYQPNLKSNWPMEIDWQNLLKHILQDINQQIPESIIAKKFHLWCKETICLITHLSKMKQVVLSGGVFQNKLLTEMIMERLQKQKISVFYPEQIPVNDGALALGQIAAMHYLYSSQEFQDVLSNPR